MINGVHGDLPIDDAIACASMLVAMGRAVPPDKWVDEPASQGGTLGGLF